jgi:hypothetical protein
MWRQLSGQIALHFNDDKPNKISLFWVFALALVTERQGFMKVRTSQYRLLEDEGLYIAIQIIGTGACQLVRTGQCSSFSTFAVGAPIA